MLDYRRSLVYATRDWPWPYDKPIGGIRLHILVATSFQSSDLRENVTGNHIWTLWNYKENSQCFVISSIPRCLCCLLGQPLKLLKGRGWNDLRSSLCSPCDADFVDHRWNSVKFLACHRYEKAQKCLLRTRHRHLVCSVKFN